MDPQGHGGGNSGAGVGEAGGVLDAAGGAGDGGLEAGVVGDGRAGGLHGEGGGEGEAAGATVRDEGCGMRLLRKVCAWAEGAMADCAARIMVPTQIACFQVVCGERVVMQGGLVMRCYRSPCCASRK